MCKVFKVLILFSKIIMGSNCSCSPMIYVPEDKKNITKTFFTEDGEVRVYTKKSRKKTKKKH